LRLNVGSLRIVILDAGNTNTDIHKPRLPLTFLPPFPVFNPKTALQESRSGDTNRMIKIFSSSDMHYIHGWGEVTQE
jgi:hypothetical protein